MDLQELTRLTASTGLEQTKAPPAEAMIAANKSLPFSYSPIQAAYSFKEQLEWSRATTYNSAVDCLTAAVYYEAAGESEVGQRAVAQVVLNRVRHPAFPSSICGVVFQGSELRTGCQFTFTCDGSLLRRASIQGWSIAKRIAIQALQGRVEPTIGMSTHYHTNYVLPYWAPKLDKVAAIGTHIFYRWSGYWGERRAFSQSYTGEASSSPNLEAAKFLKQFDVLSLSPVAATFIDNPVKPRSNLGTPLPEVRAPSSLRADEDTGTLKVDDRKVELVINLKKTQGIATD
ncbi:cell wall hydrolase [Croceibacterium salegens]|nr:cell wall hydrolase [Croceibacterium salegens]